MDAEVMPVSAVHTKKMLILDILEVLKRHTDAEHPMTQKEIIAALEVMPEITDISVCLTHFHSRCP